MTDKAEIEFLARRATEEREIAEDSHSWPAKRAHERLSSAYSAKIAALTGVRLSVDQLLGDG